MYAKIQITGNLEVKTGMHIGGSSAFSAIGAVDSPVIKDGRTQSPMIPGSSLKGKMRTLLAKEYNEEVAKKPDDDAECLTRLFGCAKKDQVKTSRLLISDMFLKNEEELRKQGLQGMTEVKVTDEKEAVEDFSILAEGFRLLQYDYLGGNGSRGYGKVVFHDLRAETVVGVMSDDILTECNRILQEAAGC